MNQTSWMKAAAQLAKEFLDLQGRIQTGYSRFAKAGICCER